MDMFYHDSDEDPLNQPGSSNMNMNSSMMTGNGDLTNGIGMGGEGDYERIAKDLIHFEKLYLKDLFLLVHVFRKALVEAIPEQEKDIEAIFSSVILDIHELTLRFLRLLEDSLEMSDTPKIGSCFLELSEGAEFDVYSAYASEISDDTCLNTLQEILQSNSVKKKLEERGGGFYMAVKYVLPKLLWVPIHHCFQYFERLEALQSVATDEGDQEDIQSTLSLLYSLKGRMNNLRQAKGESSNPCFPSMPGGTSHMKKMREVQDAIEGWEGRHIVHSCQEFLIDTLRSKNHRRLTERYVFLFDNLIVLCKPIHGNSSKTSTVLNGLMTSAAGPQGGPTTNKYKFKEKFAIRKVDVVDIEDTEDLKNCLELRNRGEADAPVILLAKNPDEKIRWMAALVFRQTRSMLDRILESVKKEEEKRIPLIKPGVDEYRFAEVDTDDNIIFEDYTSSAGIPVVKGGTLLKLVERLTYHLYTDAKFLRTFLTTYRSFCSPQDFLSLLIERFEIPYPSDVLSSFNDSYSASLNPSGSSAMNSAAAMGTGMAPNGFTNTTTVNGPLEPNRPQQQQQPTPMILSEDSVFVQSLRQRFRKQYVRPVQIKVLSVLRQWVSRHWYDFEDDPELLARLRSFLEGIPGTSMKRVVKTIITTINRSSEENGHTIFGRLEGTAAADGFGGGGGRGTVSGATTGGGQVSIIESSTNRHRRKKKPIETEFGPRIPEILWHIATEQTGIFEYDLLTLHPREIGRQVTLIESELYRAVKPIELVGAAWMKKDKHKRSPQLLKLTSHANRITYWLERQIVEAENMEERVALMGRILEIMCVFEELNNFNGLVEFYSALFSTPVIRLKASWEKLDKTDTKLYKACEKFKETWEDPKRKVYLQKLKNTNPPLVPFFGMYLWRINFLEEGNPLFLKLADPDEEQADPNVDHDTVSVSTTSTPVPAAADRQPMISFHKCRKIADVIGEIQMYQNQPYYLEDEPSMQQFFESLNPLADFDNNESDLKSYLWNQSLKIEPKGVDPAPQFPMHRKAEYLKSPGIKLPPASSSSSSSHHHHHHARGGSSGGGGSNNTGGGGSNNKHHHLPKLPTTPRLHNNNPHHNNQQHHLPTTTSEAFHLQQQSSSLLFGGKDHRPMSSPPFNNNNHHKDDASSDFAVVDIRPGDPRGPQHVFDLPDFRARSEFVAGLKTTTAGNSSSRYSPSPPVSPASPGGLSLPPPPPPLPPRRSTPHRPSPLPGPKPPHLRDKSQSPRSAAAATAAANHQQLSPLAAGLTQSSWSSSSRNGAAAFVFPVIQSSSSSITTTGTMTSAATTSSSTAISSSSTSINNYEERGGDGSSSPGGFASFTTTSHQCGIDGDGAAAGVISFLDIEAAADLVVGNEEEEDDPFEGEHPTLTMSNNNFENNENGCSAPLSPSFFPTTPQPSSTPPTLPPRGGRVPGDSDRGDNSDSSNLLILPPPLSPTRPSSNIGSAAIPPPTSEQFWTTTATSAADGSFATTTSSSPPPPPSLPAEQTTTSPPAATAPPLPPRRTPRINNNNSKQVAAAAVAIQQPPVTTPGVGVDPGPPAITAAAAQTPPPRPPKRISQIGICGSATSASCSSASAPPLPPKTYKCKK